jgi:hypothetical protein
MAGKPRRDEATEEARTKARATVCCSLDKPCAKHRVLAETVLAKGPPARR